MGLFNLQTIGAGIGAGERGPRGIAGRGISNIQSQDNNDGSITLTISYDDGTPDFVTTNTLVSDSLIQLDRLTLEGTNNEVKFLIKQADETVIYKCDTVAGINIMKQLLIGNGLKKLELRDDEITFIDGSGEHFKIFSETSGSITFKSLNGATSKILMKDLNDNEIFDINASGVNYYPTNVNYGKTSDIGGIKLEVKSDSITARRNTRILNSDLLVNNGIDIFKVRNDNSQTEIFKLFTRDIISDTDINFLDNNNLLVMKLSTEFRNLQLADTQFTVISGENGITLLNEPLTGITSILKTRTNKIIIPDTYLDIVDTTETNLIMKVKTDNNVDVYNQLNIKSSGGGGGTYTDFAFTTLSNRDNVYFAFECVNSFSKNTTGLTCTGVLDFISQYSALINTVCVLTGDMSAFSLTIDPDGRFQFSFTAGMSGSFTFAFSPEMSVQIGMSSNPPNPSKLINGGEGVGELYVLFQISGIAGATYNFQSDGLFGNVVTNNAIEITSDTIGSPNSITIECLNNLDLASSASCNVAAEQINIGAVNTGDINLLSNNAINLNIIDNLIPDGIITLSSATLNIESGITNINSNNTNIKTSISIGTEPNPFANQMVTVYNPATTEEIFNVNRYFTYIKTLNDITGPNKGTFYYSNEVTGDLNFFPKPSFDCSFIAWKSNKPVWRVPFLCQLVNNPYINDVNGLGTNSPTTIIGWSELSISDTNINFVSEPFNTFFTRSPNSTIITYVGSAVATNDYKFRIDYTVSLSGFNNQTIEIALFKNGLLVDTSVNKMMFSSNSEYEVMSRTLTLPLFKNDILSVRVKSNQAQITVSNYNMLIQTAC